MPTGMEKVSERTEKKREYDRKYNLEHKEQRRAVNSKWQADHAEERKQYRIDRRELERDYRLQRIYGLTLSEYNAMYESQEGKCAICLKVFPVLCVDHVHDETQRVRGLLCSPCNLGFGNFMEDVDILRRAIDYANAQTLFS